MVQQNHKRGTANSGNSRSKTAIVVICLKMLKTLTLLILTAIVMASVACGPSEEGLHQKQKELIQQQKIIMLCEDALERRASSEKRMAEYKIEQVSKENQHFNDPMADAITEEEGIRESINEDIDKYCK